MRGRARGSERIGEREKRGKCGRDENGGFERGGRMREIGKEMGC